jgi:hypothetical protein
MKHNKRIETDSPIVTVLASAAPARTRANDGSQLMRLLCLQKKEEIMGSKKLLGEDEKKSLFFDYHHYIIQCIRNDSKPVFNDFYDLITSSDKTFGKYTQKQLSNKIIDFRKIEGSEKWPSFSQAMIKFTMK